MTVKVLFSKQDAMLIRYVRDGNERGGPGRLFLAGKGGGAYERYASNEN